MKDTEGRWQRREKSIGTDLSHASLVLPNSDPGRSLGGSSPSSRIERPIDFRKVIGSAALAFRGFDVENVGRSSEFLEHPAYGRIYRRFLDEASHLCSEAVHRSVNLVTHIQGASKSSLDFFPEDVATIVATELAQLEILEECFDVPVHDARLGFGYSIGELSALVFGHVFSMEQLLPIPLGLAVDCAELADDLTMGVLFTRGPALSMGGVERLCRGISSEGRGLIGPSAFLSPNTALILGQGDTIDRLDANKAEILPRSRSNRSAKVMLRRNANRWPPLHSPLVWQRSIPNRTAMALYHTAGGMTKPSPTILSCVTGEASYDVGEIRDVLTDWTDHPQRLWDVIDRTLAMGVETVIHVGPRPNLIPSTFARLGANVSRHLGHRTMQLLSRGVVNSLNRNAWLARLLPSRTSLLRAPFLNHVILEDWLLAQPLRPRAVAMSGGREASS